MLYPASTRMAALIIANFVAAAAVGVVTLMAFAGFAIVSPGEAGVVAAIGGLMTYGLLFAVFAAAISFPFYLVGLIVVGIPTWWALHQAGSIRLGSFATAGVIESVLAGALVFRIFAPGSEIYAPLLAIPGSLAGWAVWNYGYSPITPPPARPS